MLLHMMASSAAGLHAACDTAEDGALGGKKKKKKELEEEGEGSLALASQLAKSLPQLLDKYGVQPEQLQAVLKLLKELRLDSAQAPHPVPSYAQFRPILSRPNSTPVNSAPPPLSPPHLST